MKYVGKLALNSAMNWRATDTSMFEEVQQTSVCPAGFRISRRVDTLLADFRKMIELVI